MQTLVFDVAGMTCGGCTSGVSRALSTGDGISNVHVSLHPGSASMDADSTKVTPEQIQAFLGRAGYRATAHIVVPA